MSMERRLVSNLGVNIGDGRAVVDGLADNYRDINNSYMAMLLPNGASFR